MKSNPTPKVWWRVFAFPSLNHICDVSADAGKEPHMYDPRIGGDGNVIWQLTDEPVVFAEAAKGGAR